MPGYRMFARSRIPLLVLCLSLASAPLSAGAEQALPGLATLLPGESLRWGEENVPAADPAIYRNVRWRGPGFDLGAQSLSLAREADGSITIEAKGLVLRSHVETGPILSVSSLSLTLDDPKANATDWKKPCDLLSTLSSFRVLDLFIELPEASGKVISKLDLQDVYFDRKVKDETCALRGIAGTGMAEVQFSDGSDLIAMETKFQVSAPLSRESISQGSKASLRAALTGVEYRGLGEIPAVGLPETSFALDVTEESLAALFHFLSPFSFWDPKGMTDLDLMQGWNAATDLDGRLLWKAPVVRLYTPGVVPEALIANFSRAGLSTISGTSEFDLSLEDRILDLDLQGGFTGLFDFTIAAQAAALPYERAKLEAGLQGADLGFHLVPDLRIGAAQLSYLDTGLDMASNDILGVPAGRQIEEIAGKTRQEAAPPADAMSNLADVLDGLARFFRLASEGEKIVVQTTPEDPFSILSIIHLMLSDTAHLPDALNLSFGKMPQEAQDIGEKLP